jgi:ABC-type bacteriocin/lantibiotic exporter with double-glycine peptidase domain
MQKEKQLNVPYAQQETPYFCGPATLSLVAKYFGIERSQSELAALAGTNDVVGTTCASMLWTGRFLGLWAFESWHATTDDLRAIIDAGVPPIIYVYEDDVPDYGHGILDHMHFYVVTGYASGSFSIHDTDPALDGGSVHGTISDRDLHARWRSEAGTDGRWMLGLSNNKVGRSWVDPLTNGAAPLPGQSEDRRSQYRRAAPK